MFLICAVAAILIFANGNVEISFSNAIASSQNSKSKKVLTKISNSHSLGANFRSKQNSEIVETKESDSLGRLSDEQRVLMCKLKVVRSTVPLEGEVQIFVASMTPFFGNESGNVAWIKSPECPDGTYSILHFSDEGKISKEIDCRKTNLTEISAMSGEQGNVDEVASEGSGFNMAISGNGYFVLQCPDSHLVLTRDGQFMRDNNGQLWSGEGCFLANSKGRPFNSFGVSSSGCNVSGDCIGIIDPAFDEIDGLEYVNSYSFTANSASFPEESVTKVGPKVLRPTFFLNALENIRDTEKGATSVSWSNHPVVNLDDLSCVQ